MQTLGTIRDLHASSRRPGVFSAPFDRRLRVTCAGIFAVVLSACPALAACPILTACPAHPAFEADGYANAVRWTGYASMHPASDIPALQIPPSDTLPFAVRRLTDQPIIHPGIPGFVPSDPENINGPSLIRVPDWVERPLGRYYLYFGHHKGDHIRMAYADSLTGPWTVHAPGVLSLERTPEYAGGGKGHLASPDVHVDPVSRRIVMYYHQPLREKDPWVGSQGSLLAVSSDGLAFEARPGLLGASYLRVFRLEDEQGEPRDSMTYALAKIPENAAALYASARGYEQVDFSPTKGAPHVLPDVRHMAVLNRRGSLYVFLSRIGDAPEHIMMSRLENPDDPWREWWFTEPVTVLKPESEAEGAAMPVEPSKSGVVYGMVHQLRDPAIYTEGDRVFLLYSVAGESGIGLAELVWKNGY